MSDRSSRDFNNLAPRLISFCNRLEFPNIFLFYFFVFYQLYSFSLRPWRPFQSEPAPESLVVRRFSNVSLKSHELTVNDSYSENTEKKPQSNKNGKILTPPVRTSVLSASAKVNLEFSNAANGFSIIAASNGESSVNLSDSVAFNLNGISSALLSPFALKKTT